MNGGRGGGCDFEAREEREEDRAGFAIETADRRRVIVALDAWSGVEFVFWDHDSTAGAC